MKTKTNFQNKSSRTINTHLYFPLYHWTIASVSQMEIRHNLTSFISEEQNQIPQMCEVTRTHTK